MQNDGLRKETMERLKDRTMDAMERCQTYVHHRQNIVVARGLGLRVKDTDGQDDKR